MEAQATATHEHLCAVGEAVNSFWAKNIATLLYARATKSSFAKGKARAVSTEPMDMSKPEDTHTPKDPVPSSAKKVRVQDSKDNHKKKNA